MSTDKTVSAFPDGDNLFNWKGTIQGAPSTVSLGDEEKGEKKQKKMEEKENKEEKEDSNKSVGILAAQKVREDKEQRTNCRGGKD